MKRAAAAAVGGARAVVLTIVLAPIRFYRAVISPNLAPRCRYYPTCSAYAEEAIREVGVIRGTLLAAWRVVRCNPFSKGGIDAVADRPFFRASAAAEPPASHRGATG